jgi:hypothetical protein
MAETFYTLPVINNRPAGIIKSYLIVDSSIGALTVPTKLRILNIDEIIERVDAEAGSTEIENVNITLAEDYDAYSEGFWYKILIENPSLSFDIMLTIMNGTDEEFVFRGSAYRLSSEISEMFLDNVSTPTKWVRGVKIQFVSSLIKFQNINIADLCTQIATHYVTMTAGNIIGLPTTGFASLKSVFASMVSLTFGSTYDESTIVNNGDFQVTSTPNFPPATWINWIDSYAYCGWFGSDIADTTNYSASFSNAWNLLKHICAEFGVIPRYWYGDINGLIDPTPTNNKHRITFNTRGKSGNVVTPSGKLMESTLIPETSKKAQRLRVWGAFPTDESWFYDGTLTYETTAETWRQFDKEIELDFDTSQTLYSSLFQSDGAGNCFSITDVQYWDYSTGAVVSVDNFARAVAQYYFARYSPKKLEYDRKYSSIKANNGSTDSQRWMQNLNQHSINDGLTARNVYATEIHKDLLNNTVQVFWIEQ